MSTKVEQMTTDLGAKCSLFPPVKKISVSSDDNTTPPRKKSSLKENIVSVFRSPAFIIRRETARKRWNQMRDRLRLNRIKVAVKDSKLFSPGERRRRSTENRETPTPAAAASPRLSPHEWQIAFDNVIYDEEGRDAFMRFLQTEYSEENILFWWAAEQLKDVVQGGDRIKFEETVLEMFDTFITAESPLAINIDHDTRKDIITRVENQASATFPHNLFDKAQAHVYRLMEKDCFSRFVHTECYKEVAKKLSLPQNFRFSERLSAN